MPTITERLTHLWPITRCCPPPPKITTVTAQAGGGSGEIDLTWDPLPASAAVAFYRVYEKRHPGQYWNIAVVTDAALGAILPGKLGVTDAFDYWPWPSSGPLPGPRCFVVTAVSTHGLEGPFSDEACATPIGG